MVTKLARIPAPTAARKGKTWPRGPVDQTIREPSDIVGEHSGKVYATLAENAPEALKIIPRPGVKHYARGGRIDVRKYAAGGTIDLSGGTGVTPSQSNVYDTKSAAYNQELQNANQQLTDEKNVAAQAKNTPDLEAAAQAQTTQNTEDQMYSQLGVAKPADVAVAPGGAAVSGSPLARTAIQSQMEVQSAQAARDRAISYAQSRVNSAQIGIVSNQQAEQDRIATNARQARSDADQAMADKGFVRGDNGEWVNKATYRNQLSDQSYARDQARPAAAKAASASADNLPVGMTRDPETKQIVSFDELRQREAARGAVYDPATRTYTTQADLKSRTDAFGNVARPDGTLVSPQGNELRTDPTTGKKQWTDPLTGNVLVNPTTWADTKGNQFHITNDKTGAGYWESPGGFVLGADGIWENKATGEQIINGVRYSPQQLSAYRATKTARAPSVNIDAAPDAAPDSTAATDTAPQYDENGDPIAP